MQGVWPRRIHRGFSATRVLASEADFQAGATLSGEHAAWDTSSEDSHP